MLSTLSSPLFTNFCSILEVEVLSTIFLSRSDARARECGLECFDKGNAVIRMFGVRSVDEAIFEVLHSTSPVSEREERDRGREDIGIFRVEWQPLLPPALG